MLISEIEPIESIGINLLQKENPEGFIDEEIELPLRNACKIFLEKGIETVMSSSNKNNVLPIGEKPIEREDIYGNEGNYNFPTEDEAKDDIVVSDGKIIYPFQTFEDAGKGYSWIMINFDSLSDYNKDFLFSIEEKTGDNGEKIGEKIIWFLHPFTIGNLDYKIKTGQYSYEYLRTCLSDDEMPEKIEIDERLSKFEKRHIVLSYNEERYPINTVLIRMPMKETTTVEEVDEYFTNFARCFKSQRRLEDLPNNKDIIEENTI